MYVAHGLSQLDFSEPLIELPISPSLTEYSKVILAVYEAGSTWTART